MTYVTHDTYVNIAWWRHIREAEVGCRPEISFIYQHRGDWDRARVWVMQGTIARFQLQNEPSGRPQGFGRGTQFIADWLHWQRTTARNSWT